MWYRHLNDGGIMAPSSVFMVSRVFCTLTVFARDVSFFGLSRLYWFGLVRFVFCFVAYYPHYSYCDYYYYYYTTATQLPHYCHTTATLQLPLPLPAYCHYYYYYDYYYYYFYYYFYY